LVFATAGCTFPSADVACVVPASPSKIWENCIGSAGEVRSGLPRMSGMVSSMSSGAREPPASGAMSHFPLGSERDG
jgi:hypothetical protein